MRQVCLLVFFLLRVVLILDNRMKEKRKKNESYRLENKKQKPSLCSSDDMIICIGIPIDAID